MGVFERIKSHLEGEIGLLPGGGRVVLAVSGGADSRCALDCLHRLGYSLCVAHFDHGLRAGSERDSAFVRGLAGEYGHPFRGEKWNDPDRSSGVEADARWARYSFLVRVAKEIGSHFIATGHTMSDQAETILLHLVRGAGLEGLTGMKARTDLSGWMILNKPRNLYLVRPLLVVRHAETIAYCRERGLEWLEDPTNLDVGLARNKLRNQVIPLLEELNPLAESAVARSGNVLRPVKALVDGIGERAWEKTVQAESRDSISIDREEFARLPDAVQLWVVRRATAMLAELVELGWETTCAVASAIAERGIRPAQLPAGIMLVNDGPRAILALESSGVSMLDYPQMAEPGGVPLGIPGRVALSHGWLLVASAIKGDGQPFSREPWGRDRWRAHADLAEVGRLEVRGFHPGDRIQPLGMDGHVKLGDLFTNEKIPRRAREAWPIVTSETGEVIWVAGLRLAHPYRVRSQSQSIVLLEATHPESDRD